jgi:hypothetical protein
MEIIQFVGYCRVNSEIQGVITFSMLVVKGQTCLGFRLFFVCACPPERVQLAFRRNELWIQILSYVISNKAASAYDLVKNYIHI